MSLMDRSARRDTHQYLAGPSSKHFLCCCESGLTSRDPGEEFSCRTEHSATAKAVGETGRTAALEQLLHPTAVLSGRERTITSQNQCKTV